MSLTVPHAGDWQRMGTGWLKRRSGAWASSSLLGMGRNGHDTRRVPAPVLNWAGWDGCIRINNLLQPLMCIPAARGAAHIRASLEAAGAGGAQFCSSSRARQEPSLGAACRKEPAACSPRQLGREDWNNNSKDQASVPSYLCH